MNAEESELIRRIRAGDEAAFRAISERYSGTLLRSIEKRLAPELRRNVGASDILQEAYLVALARMTSFEDRGEGSFLKWLDRIAEMKVRDAVKRHRRQRRAVGREIPPGERPDTNAFAGRVPTPSAVAMGAETERRVKEAIAALPEAHRDALRLLMEKQLSLDEVARRMGRTREAVQKLYERALAALAERMGLSPGKHERG